MAAQTDFWGDLAPAEVRTPVAIMREQAGLLGTKTQNLVEARVDTEISRFANEQFSHSLDLVVPALDYTYRLFTIRHGIGLYPITVRQGANANIQLDTEEEFVDWLRQKLSSAETKRIVASLLAQVST